MKIKHQQFIILLFTSVLLFSVLSIFIYFHQRQVLRKQIYSQLESIATAKENRIKGIIETAKEIATFPAISQYIIENLTQFKERPDQDYLNGISLRLKRYGDLISSFNELHLANLNGEIIASSDSSIIGRNFSKHEAFTVPASGKKYLDGFHYNERNQLNLFLSSPIFSGNKLMGVLIIETNPGNILSITNDYAGLGETGEVSLGKRYGDSIVYLTPLRFDRNAALKRKIAITDTSFAMIKAVSRKEGLIPEVIDYLGDEVIAVTRHIPESDWGMVVKITEREAMLPVYGLRNALVLFNLGAFVLAVIVSLIAGNYFAKPIHEMIQTSNKIKEGDLSARVSKISNNELGLLANSINHMASRLQKKVEQLDNYAYMISHDLKAPLAAIEGLILLMDDQPLDKEGKEMSGMIKTKAEEMRSMVDNILKSAMQQNKELEYINLLHIAKKVVQSLNPPNHYHIFIQHNLPIVKCDRTSIIQIFQNLLSNAIKYNNKEQPLIKIIHTEFAKYYKVCIEDNGEGIPKEKLATVFQIFETAHTEERSDSHGIGLSIVKQLVEENGGKIWVESFPGEGSIFHFTIPK